MNTANFYTTQALCELGSTAYTVVKNELKAAGIDAAAMLPYGKRLLPMYGEDAARHMRQYSAKREAQRKAAASALAAKDARRELRELKADAADSQPQDNAAITLRLDQIETSLHALESAVATLLKAVNTLMTDVKAIADAPPLGEMGHMLSNGSIPAGLTDD